MLKNAFHIGHKKCDEFILVIIFYLFFGVQMVKMTIRRSTSKEKGALVFFSLMF